MRRRVIEAQFLKPTKLPDGITKDFVNATPREDLHPDRWDPYTLEWDTEDRGLYVTVTRGHSKGRQALILGCHSVSFEPETDEKKIGAGKAGPGRGHKGPLQPEAA